MLVTICTKSIDRSVVVNRFDLPETAAITYLWTRSRWLGQRKFNEQTRKIQQTNRRDGQDVNRPRDYFRHFGVQHTVQN